MTALQRDNPAAASLSAQALFSLFAILKNLLPCYPWVLTVRLPSLSTLTHLLSLLWSGSTFAQCFVSSAPVDVTHAALSRASQVQKAVTWCTVTSHLRSEGRAARATHFLLWSYEWCRVVYIVKARLWLFGTSTHFTAEIKSGAGSAQNITEV